MLRQLRVFLGARVRHCPTAVLLRRETAGRLRQSDSFLEARAVQGRGGWMPSKADRRAKKPSGMYPPMTSPMKAGRRAR